MSNESSPQQKPPSNSLDEHFASFAARVEKIDEAIDVNDHQSLVTARGNLAEIIAELEKLHVDEVGLRVGEVINFLTEHILTFCNNLLSLHTD
jgi:hypothetical protein